MTLLEKTIFYNLGMLSQFQVECMCFENTQYNYDRVLECVKSEVGCWGNVAPRVHPNTESDYLGLPIEPCEYGEFRLWENTENQKYARSIASQDREQFSITIPFETPVGFFEQMNDRFNCSQICLGNIEGCVSALSECRSFLPWFLMPLCDDVFGAEYTFFVDLSAQSRYAVKLKNEIKPSDHLKKLLLWA